LSWPDTFDSFECAIHALAPTCENCGIRIVGHGLEKDVPSSAASIAPRPLASPACAIGSARRRDRNRERGVAGLAHSRAALSDLETDQHS